MTNKKRQPLFRAFLVAFLVGILSIGGCAGLVYLDQTQPLFATAGGGTLLAGHSATLLFAAAALMAVAAILTFAHDTIRHHRLDREREKIRSARYGVLYCIVNRMSRDYGVLNRMRNLFPGLGVQGNFRISSSDHLVEVTDLLRTLAATLENRDGRSQTLPADFSLLEAEEERAVMKYFDLYNGLEDEVRWLLPKAQRGASEPEGEIDWGRRDKMVLEQGLELLFGQLLCTYQMAGEVAAKLTASADGDYSSFEEVLMEHRARNLFAES